MIEREGGLRSVFDVLGVLAKGFVTRPSVSNIHKQYSSKKMITG
jgi:hypothetical protein